MMDGPGVVFGDPGGKFYRKGISTALVSVLILSSAVTARAAYAVPNADREKSDYSVVGPAGQKGREVAAAEQQASRTGKPVEVISERTETDETWVNPDGTYRVERYLLPQRVRKGGKLVTVDSTLSRREGGRIAPEATGLAVSFSGGGDNAFATMVKDGREVSLSWPGLLPEPVLSGDTATYREVLPGVDLTATATVGSFSHSLVVKNARAARNPELAAVTFGLRGKGLTLKPEASGGIQAVDPTGRPVFAAPKPQMWDSGGVQRLTSPGTKARSARAVRPLADALGGAAEGSKRAPIGVRLARGTLTLTPDPKLLSASDTVYPVVIDPRWAADSFKNAWSIAYQHTGHADSGHTVYYNGGTLSKEARVGSAIDPDGGTVSANTYFRISTGNVWNKQIIKSVLRVKQTYAGSWSCTSGDILVKDIGKSLPGNITWNKQPAWLSTVDASGESFGGRNCPMDTAGLVEFDVTSAISKAAKDRHPAWAFALTARSTTVDHSWRKFDPNSVRVSTLLNTPPAKPANPSTNPSVPCAGGTFGITDYVTLRARVNDAEDNNLKVQFQYALVGSTAAPVRPARVNASRNTVAGLRIDTRTLASGTYWWNVVASDGTASSPVSETCRFTFDKSAPSKLPGIDSKEFPAETDGNPARTKGVFHLTNGGVSDVTHWLWWTDSDATERFVHVKDFPDPLQPPKFEYTPLSAGPQYLYLRSIDAAGNRSALRAYLFIPTRAPQRDKPGDLNGDGTVDLWSVDPGGGALWAHPGQGNGRFGVGQQADDESFAEAMVTHRGSWNEDYYEDLVALRPGSEDPARKELWVYSNEGNGRLAGTETGRRELEVVSDDANHWHNADQVLSIGSMNDDNGDGTVTDVDAPDLLVKTGGQLWLYLGAQGSVFLDEFSAPIPLGNADWQDMTLMAPGDLNNDGLPELWVRDGKAGSIHQYTSRRNANTSDVTSADLAVYGDASARGVSIGSGFTSAAYPHLSTEGDFEGDGFADLWARDGVGASVEFPGRTLTSDSAFGAARPLVTGGTPWGTCQVFESTATGKQSLCGPVLAKYKALGGPAAFGYPTSGIRTAGDGTGRYVHFLQPGTTTENRSIFWSPDTGAWSVRGSIWAKWNELGRDSGVLGYPTSDERATSDGVGRVTTFTKGGRPGAIYYAAGIGAFSIRGPVYSKYLELGATRALGYPTTDIRSTSPKSGSFQRYRFRHETADSSSIYWSSSTGAWPVSGQIRAKWTSIESENGWLGFPTSDEYEVTGGTRTDFENGYVRWNRVSGIATACEPSAKTGNLRTELAGDVDGDGRSDMITVYDYGDASTGLHVMSANPAGGFDPPQEAWTSTRGGFDYTRSTWASGDFNADGRADVAAFYGYPDGSVATWSFLGEADGTFKRVVKTTTNPSIWSWSASQMWSGDFNGDNRADLAMLYDYGNATSGLHTFTAKADGTFNAPVAGWKSGAGGWDATKSRMVPGDFDADGGHELIGLYQYEDGSAALWRFSVTSTGSFAGAGKGWDSNGEAWRVTSRVTGGDFNGDNRTDIAAFGGNIGALTLTTFTAAPGGGFSAPRVNWLAPPWSERWGFGRAGALISGDANGDGIADVAVMWERMAGDSRAYTFMGKSSGNFDSPQPSWHAEPGTW